MERNLKKSGLNLNPMYYWKYVKGVENRLPCILIKGKLSEGLRNFLIHFPQINLIIEDGQQTPELKNVLYRERDRLTDKEWLKGLSVVDYLICNKRNEEYWVQAALCGVEVIFSEKDWIGKKIKVRSYLERIETWEQVKNILTQSK